MSSDLLKGLNESEEKEEQGFGAQINLNSPPIQSSSGVAPSVKSPAKSRMLQPRKGVNNSNQSPQLLHCLQTTSSSVNVTSQNVTFTPKVIEMQAQGKITGNTISEIKKALDVNNIAFLKEIANRGPDFQKLVENLTQDSHEKDKGKRNSQIPSNARSPSMSGIQLQSNSPINTSIQITPNAAMLQHQTMQQTMSTGVALGRGNNSPSVQQGRINSTVFHHSALPIGQGRPVATAVLQQQNVAHIQTRPSMNIHQQQHQLQQQQRHVATSLDQRMMNAKNVADQMVKLASLNKTSLGNSHDSSSTDEDISQMDQNNPGLVGKKSARMPLPHLQPSQLVTTQLGQQVPMGQQSMTNQGQQQGNSYMNISQSQMMQGQNVQMTQQQMGQVTQMGQGQGDTTISQQGQQGQYVTIQNQPSQSNRLITNLMSSPGEIQSNLPQQQQTTRTAGNILTQQGMSSSHGGMATEIHSKQSQNNLQQETMVTSAAFNNNQMNVPQTQLLQRQQETVLERRVNTKKQRGKKNMTVVYVPPQQAGVGGDNSQAGFTSQQKISVQQQGNVRLTSNNMGGDNNQNVMGMDMQNVQNSRNAQGSPYPVSQPSNLQENQYTYIENQRMSNQGQMVASQSQPGDSSHIYVNVSDKNITREELQKQVQLALESQGKNIKVLPAQGAQTQVINSTGIRPTAPRPYMSTQHRHMIPRSSMAASQNVRVGGVHQIRSDQQYQMARQQAPNTIDSVDVQAQHHYNNIVNSQRSHNIQGAVRPRMVSNVQMTQAQYQHHKSRNMSQQMPNQMQAQRPMVANNRQLTVNQVQIGGAPAMQQQMVNNSQVMVNQGSLNPGISQQMISNQGGITSTNSQQMMGNSQQMVGNSQHIVGNTQHVVGNSGTTGMMVRPGVPNMMVRQTGMQQPQGGLMKPGGSIYVNTQQSQQQTPQQGMGQSRVISAHQQQFLNSIQGNPQGQQLVGYTAEINTQPMQVVHPQVVQQQQPIPVNNSQLQPQLTQQNIGNQPQQVQEALSPNNSNPNEPNILPLSSSSENDSSQNITSVPGGANNQALVQGQEYLIQYSNGKKVIGIWDGKFFKVRGASMSGTTEGCAEEAGGRAVSTPSSSQQSVTGAMSSPEGTPMLGGGLAERKIKGNASGMNLVGMNVSQTAGGDANANWHNNLNSNLTRRPIHDTGQPSGTTDTPTTVMLEVKKAHKRPPRPREEGKYAVCKNCGAYSNDYDNCESCHKPIPEDAKLYQPEMGSMAKKPRTEAEHPAGTEPQFAVAGGSVTPQKAKLLVVQTGNQQAVVIAQAAQAAAKGLASARGGRGGKARGGKGRGKPNPKKSPEIETVTILSSDDETDHSAGAAAAAAEAGTSEMTPVAQTGQQQAGFIATPVASGTPLVAGNLAPMQKAGYRQRMEDETGKVLVSKNIQQQQKRQQQAATQLARSQDLSSILVQLQSRSIRIGSYRGQPADHFKITVQGVQFTITWGEDCLQIHIGSNEITKVMCHLGESMPCMFLDTTPSCAQRLRQALEMEPGKEPFYDPQSPDEVHRRITVIFENLGELGIENYIRALFQVMQAGNPYFQKEGSLLEEIEYQEANQILINSTPQASLQLLNLGLGVGFPGCEDEHDEEEEPIDRSRSPSPARIFNGEIVKLFTYPPPPSTGGITVTNEDLFCLNDGEFLNDVIIDFYLKYLYNKQGEPVQKKTHVFSSFFYRRLTSKQNKRHGDDQNTSIQEKRHSRVKTWTRHVDLFDKDFIIVPINESAHWYLAIICYPGLLEPEYSQDSQQQPTPSSQASTSATPTLTAIPTPASKKAGGKKSAKAIAEAKAQKDMLDAMREKNAQEDQNSNLSKEDGMDTDESSQGGLPQQDGKICKQPCILIFDSLAGPSRTNVIRTLREYLQVEWDVKKKEKCGARVMDKETVRGNSPKCPQQMNFSDCGVYVLQYVESFFEEPIKDFSVPIRGLEEWFTEDTALCKREELRQLIVALQKQINPTLEYDPAQDGCMIGGLEDDDDDDEDLPNLLKLGTVVAGGTAAASGNLAVVAKLGTVATLGNVVATTTKITAVDINNSSSANNSSTATVSSIVNNSSCVNNSGKTNNNTSADSNVTSTVVTQAVVSSKPVLMLKTANLTAEQIVAAVTKREGKS